MTLNKKRRPWLPRIRGGCGASSARVHCSVAPVHMWERGAWGVAHYSPSPCRCASPAATSMAMASNPLAQVSRTGLVTSSEASDPVVSSERRPTSPHGWSATTANKRSKPG